jgi:radical SAM superfamily enzyme YgiQ (UPF0313 family)
MSKPNIPKIVIITIPLRGEPTDFPPIGSLSVITSLKRAGFTNTCFYNIDYLRPAFDEIIDYLKKEQPDILGISAVVSTTYAFTKKLSLAVKQALPETTILMGGNLGASAEIVLQKTGTDYICTGEGEKTAVNFTNRWLTAEKKSDFTEVEGLAFLDENGQLIITPYPEPIPAEEVYDIDWSILEELGEMSHYVKKNDNAGIDISFRHDHRRLEPHRQGKALVILSASKGCVARCTFCHRWDKGIRYIPVPVIMKRIDYMIEKHNVGFMSFGDENFGTDKRWLEPFLEEIKKRDLLWRVSGMRVNCITPDWIAKMKDAGCSSILYGMESGSQKILDIMEKKTTAEQNRDTVKWMVENKLFTIIQLVIGMPGETPETIRESGDLTCHFVEQSPEVDPNNLSVNFAQALPGTPLYETARRQGYIGNSLEEEEKYLLGISDRDARDGETYINLTDYPQLLLEDWYFEICSRTRMAYINQWGIDRYWDTILHSSRFKNLDESQSLVSNPDTGYFASPAREKEIALRSPHPSPAEKKMALEQKDGARKFKIPSVWSLMRQNALSSISSFYPRFFWYTRYFSILFTFANTLRKYGKPHALKMLREYMRWKFTNSFSPSKKIKPMEHISLRKLLRKKYFPEIPRDNPVMAPLRKGR